MNHRVLLVFVLGCTAAAFAHDVPEIVTELMKEDVFKKCSDMFCADPAFVDKEKKCHEKLSKEIQDESDRMVKECYGLSDDVIDLHKLMEVFCEDIPKSYQCHLKAMAEFSEKETTSKQEAELMEYFECMTPIYDPCLH